MPIAAKVVAAARCPPVSGAAVDVAVAGRAAPEWPDAGRSRWCVSTLARLLCRRKTASVRLVGLFVLCLGMAESPHRPIASQVDLECFGVVFKAERRHCKKNVLAVDRLAFLLLALLGSCETRSAAIRLFQPDLSDAPSLVMKEMNSLTHSCMHSLASFAIFALSGSDVFMMRATGAKLAMNCSDSCRRSPCAARRGRLRTGLAADEDDDVEDKLRCTRDMAVVGGRI